MSNNITKIIITVLMLIAEICGTIICFSKLFIDPFTIILVWSICTLCAFILWHLTMDMVDND